MGNDGMRQGTHEDMVMLLFNLFGVFLS